MKRISNIFLSVILLTSCSAEIADIAEQNIEDYADGITITTEPFKYGGNTRVSISPQNLKYITSWDVADGIGVFPTAPQGNMTVDNIIKLDNDKHYGYIAKGWNIDLLNKYTAFYPVDNAMPVNTPFNAVPVDIRNQDGSLVTLAKKFDYMWANGSIIENVASLKGKAMLDFHFKHAIAILATRIKVPTEGIWQRLEIVDEAGQPIFTQTGTLDTRNGVVTPIRTNSGFDIGFNVNFPNKRDIKPLMSHFAVFPVNVKRLVYRLWASGGKCYTCTVGYHKAFKQGCVYFKNIPSFRWTVDLGLSRRWGRRRRGIVVNNVNVVINVNNVILFPGGNNNIGVETQGDNENDDDDNDKNCYHTWEEGQVYEENDSTYYPTKSDWMELLSSCQLKLEYDGDEYYFEVVGPSGNFIHISIVGYKDENGDIKDEECAYYWTNELDYLSIPPGGTVPEKAWAIKINKDKKYEFVSMSRNDSLCVENVENVEYVNGD